MVEKMIEIPFIYQIEGIKKRGKNASTFNVIDSHNIIVKDISNEELTKKKSFTIIEKQKKTSKENENDYYYIDRKFNYF